MAISFPGRIEAKLVVPSGGASVSASNANGGSAATVTVPSAAYYLSAAGGISGLVATLESQLNSTAALHGFPRTPSVMDDVVGGDWTNGSGWLCQEESGNLAPVFGAVTLTASGTPTYQNDGIKDGDYAVGFDSATDAFGGGNADFDVDGSADIVFAGVLKLSADLAIGTVNRIVHKRGAGAGYTLYLTRNSSLSAGISLVLHDGTNQIFPSILTIDWSANTDVWFAVVAAVERSTNTARVAVQNLETGEKFVGPSADISSIGSMSNASAFSIGTSTAQPWHLSALYVVSGSGVATGLSAGLSTALTNFANAINAAWSVSLSDTTGQVIINWSGYETPTHSLTWTSTALRDMLGFDANISNATSATTGAAQSPACWLPDAPLNVDGHPAMTPEETDLRVTESPTGVTLGLTGNTKYVHTNVRYRRVPVDRIREADAAVDNASLEVFLRNTQFGQGDISWFTPASQVQVWWNSAGTLTLLGDDANSGTGVEGWTIVGISSFAQAVRLSQDGYTGHFDVTFPRLVSAG